MILVMLAFVVMIVLLLSLLLSLLLVVPNIAEAAVATVVAMASAQHFRDVIVLLDDGGPQAPLTKMLGGLKDGLSEVGMLKESHSGDAPWPAN
jgi:Na+/H+ antiporter NhaC